MFTFLPTKHLPKSVLFAFKSSMVRGIRITEHDETYGKKRRLGSQWKYIEIIWGFVVEKLQDVGTGKFPLMEKRTIWSSLDISMVLGCVFP